ncbi:FAD-dependent oxidoreductase [Vibrio sp. PP-XX7]
MPTEDQGTQEKLNLSEIGLTADSRGLLTVDHNYQTDVAHIYAVGDLIGYPSLASAAYDQGRFVAQIIAHGEAQGHLIEDIPTGIYAPFLKSVQSEKQKKS